MSDFRVLIVGAGIAGSVAAYWIGKTGARVTVIEKSPELRTVGQGLDLHPESKEIVKRMGVFDAICAKATKESGSAIVKDNGEIVAALDLEKDGISPTSEIEIMRKDLAEILYQAASSIPSVKFKFKTEFLSISEEDDRDGSGVRVELTDGSTQSYDLVIGADGLGSRTRKAMLGPEAFKASFKPVGAYAAYFSIPAESQDGPRARWYTTIGHRTIAIRPYTKSISSVYFIVVDEPPKLQEAYSSNDQTYQKQAIASLFKDVKFHEIPRLLSAMMIEPNFFFQRVVQVKIPPSSWSGSKLGRGRITLVGDAGYCPSPFTGAGTAIAVQGSYSLACELANEIKITTAGGRPNVQRALSNYAEKFAPVVEEAQSIPLWGYAPKFFSPGTWVGLWVLRTLFWTLDRFRVLKLILWFSGDPNSEAVKIPEFSF